MRQRCLYPNNAAFDRYGGRGITICERWLVFRNFLTDMGERPPGLSIERIDNNRGYEPGNCKWASPAEQSRNKRNNRFYTIRGVTGCLHDLIRRFHFDKSTIYRRLGRGWTVEQAFTIPPDPRKQRQPRAASG